MGGPYVNSATVKANRILNLLRRNMSRCSKKAKSMAYLALVRPHLEYAAPVWSPYLRKDIDRLEKVENRAARWIGAKWNSSTYQWSKSSELCRSELHWPTLETRRKVLSCCQTFKIIHHMNCIDFDKYFSFTLLSTTRSHSLSLQCKSSRVNAYRHSFFVNSPFIWNSLPFSVVSCNSYVLRLC